MNQTYRPQVVCCFHGRFCCILGCYLAIILYLLISVWCVFSSFLLPPQQIALWFLSWNLNLNLLCTYIFKSCTFNLSKKQKVTQNLCQNGGFFQCMCSLSNSIAKQLPSWILGVCLVCLDGPTQTGAVRGDCIGERWNRC